MIQVYELETANESEDRVIQIDVDTDPAIYVDTDPAKESLTFTVKVKDVYGVSCRHVPDTGLYQIYLYTSNCVIDLGEFQDMEESLKLEHALFPNRKWKQVA